MLDSTIKWSEQPGRFERHLKRRFGNSLFAIERQKVSVEEIVAAKQRDDEEQKAFWAWFNEFTHSIPPETNPSEFIALIQDLQYWREHAAAIGGKAFSKIDNLVIIEDQLMDKLDEIFPTMKAQSKSIRSLSLLGRIPFIAETRMPDSPILKGEEAASLLCEDLNTIAAIGVASHAFPDFHPNDEEIKQLLKLGLNLKRFTDKEVKEIESAWAK